MSTKIVTLEPVTVVMTGIEFLQYGKHYLRAADHLSSNPSDSWFDPLPYQLACQSLELHLKGFIWLTDRLSRDKIKYKYGHDIAKLWRHSKERGISKYCKPTSARDRAIEFLSPYYKERKFAYLDIVMSGRGIRQIKARPEEKRVVSRLCKQLQRSLKKPIVKAS